MIEVANPRWDAVMEKRGPEEVRVLLTRCGSGEGAAVWGLGEAVEDMPTRGYAARWLAQQDEQRALREHQAATRSWWTRGDVIAGAVGALAAVITLVEGWFRVK